MSKVVVLKLEGDLEQHGFRVVLEIGLEGDRPLMEVPGALPPNPGLLTQLQAWQQTYRGLKTASRIMPQEILYGGSIQRLEQCRQASDALRDRFTDWLESSPTFYPIDRRLREALSVDDQIRVLIRTLNPTIRQLPWHLWEFLDRYPYAEVALAAPTVQRLASVRVPAHDKVRILAILGNRTGIDIDADRQTLAHLPHADVRFLVEPPRRELNQQLWDQPWDILFFAGHSHTEGHQGRLLINAHESLTLGELKYGLRQAIAQGLQLAIFNSCDGLGLAEELEQLHLPQLIVMRELVPDPVAQEFLKQFLASFVRGTSLYLAERQARERLQGLEGDFPCASWLPMICQHSTDCPPTWQSLQGLPCSPSVEVSSQSPRSIGTLAAIVFTDVESFTSQMAADEQGTLNRIQRDFQLMRDYCQRFDGNVLKSLGDGLLMSFASAERAVSCAIAIQTQLATVAFQTAEPAPLKHRIGIHLGEVELIEGDVLGTGVNIAARLQQESPAGGICLSRTVYEVVKHRLTVPIRDGGLRSLKGIPDNLQVYLIAPPSLLPIQTNGIPRTSRWPRFTGSLSGMSSRRREVLVISWLVTSLVMGLRLIGGLQTWELQALDQMMRWRPIEPLDQRLLLITVDEADLTYQKQQGMRQQGSLSDQALNQLLQKLEPHQPSVIGLDIYRDRAVEPSQADLQKRLQTIVTVCTIKTNVTGASVQPPPDLAIAQVGFANLPLDPDRLIRRHNLGMDADRICATDESLAYQLAKRYLARHDRAVATPEQTPNRQLYIGNRLFAQLLPHAGGYHRLDWGGYGVMLNYRRPHPAATISLEQVLNGSLDAQLNHLVRDRIVLIGTTARSYNDYHATPLGDMAGVMIHAQAISQIVSTVLDGRPLISTLPQWGDALWVWGWSLAGGWVALSWRVPRHWGWGGLVIMVCLTGSCFGLFLRGGWLPLIPAGLASSITGCSVVLWQRRS